MHLTVLTIEYPDYFQGCSEPYICCPVHKDMTKEQLIVSLTNQLWEYEDFLPDTTLEEFGAELDSLILVDLPFANISAREEDEILPNIYIKELK